MSHGVAMPHRVAMPCTVTPPGGDGAPRGDGASQGDNALQINNVPWGDDASRGDDALQISDAPWDDDASQGGIPMGAAMPLRTRARELIQAHPSSSTVSPCPQGAGCPLHARTEPAPLSALGQPGARWRWPCGVPVTCRCLLGHTPLGTCLLRGGQLRICPAHPQVPASTVPSLTPGLPAATGTRWHRGRSCPWARPVFWGSFNIYSTQREEQHEGWRCGVVAVPGAGREGERRERGREPSVRARPGAAVSVVGPCRGGHSWCWGRRKAKSQN